MSKISRFIDKNITLRSERKRALQSTIESANEQINFFKSQQQLAQDTVNKLQNETNVERRKIQEKQIRQLRRSFRSPGFLEDVSTGIKDTLG